MFTYKPTPILLKCVKFWYGLFVSVDEVRLELSVQLFQALETEQTSVSVLSRPVHFELVPVNVFAQQLTYVDAVSTKKSVGE